MRLSIGYDPDYFGDPSYVSMVPNLHKNLVAYTIRITVDSDGEDAKLVAEFAYSPSKPPKSPEAFAGTHESRTFEQVFLHIILTSEGPIYWKGSGWRRRFGNHVHGKRFSSLCQFSPNRCILN